MTTTTTESTRAGAPAQQTFYPCVFYDDAPAAIASLGRALGFAPVLVVPGATEGMIEHAELRLGDALIMLGTARPGEYWRSPRALTGTNQAVYMVVATPEVDRLFAAAVAAGGTAIQAPRDEDYGGRSAVVRDPEGHDWCLGSYRPALAG